MSVIKIGCVLFADRDFARLIIFPRKNGQTIASMKRNVPRDSLKDRKLEIKKGNWYNVYMDGDEITNLVLVPVPIAKVVDPDKFEIELTFSINYNDRIYENIGIAQPCSTLALGPLLFGSDRIKIPPGVTYWSGIFRLLDDNEKYANIPETTSVSWILNSLPRALSGNNPPPTTPSYDPEKEQIAKEKEMCNIILKIMGDSEVLHALKSDDRDVYEDAIAERNNYQDYKYAKECGPKIYY